MVKDIAIGAGGSGFDSRAGQIRHNAANGSPPLQRFFGAVLPRRETAEMDPATRYTLHLIPRVQYRFVFDKKIIRQDNKT